MVFIFVLYMTRFVHLICFVLCKVPLEKYQVINQTLQQWVGYYHLQGHRVGLHKSIQGNT